MSVRLRIEAFGTSRPLDPARQYWIGTNPDADIVVKSKLAAPVHALVSCEGGSWTIQVVGAAPPVQVSGKRLAPGAPPIPLGPGLVLEIGGDTLRVQRDDAAGAPTLARAGQTVALLLGKKWLETEGPPPAFRILFPGGADGPRREPVDVREERVTVGSAPECTVRIEGAFVAPSVIAIVRRNGGFWIETLVDPLPADVALLEADRALRTGDRIAVGPCDLRFAIEGESAGINVQQRARPERAVGEFQGSLAASQSSLRTIAMPMSAMPGAGGPATRTEAPRYRKTSDLVRARVILPFLVLAAAVGGIVALGGGAAAGGSRTIGAHHTAAGLACTSCHAEGGRVMVEACAGCHVPPTPPDEQTHAKLSRASRSPHAALTCTTCHRIHHGNELVVAKRGPGAVVVDHVLDGAVLSETALAPTHPLGQYLPEGRAVAWPVVRTTRCMTCHHPESAADPARHCFADLTDPATLPVTCDDEHHEEPTPEASTGAVARRAVLVPGADLAAARALGAAVLAKAESRESGGGAGLGLPHAAAAGLVLLGVVLGAALSRRRFVAPPAAAARVPAGVAAVPAAALVGKKLVPTVDTGTCIGCGACVDSCPRGVLSLNHFWAEVVAPEACCGFMLCEAVCPNRSLKIVEGEPPSDRPRVGDDRQSVDVPGLWLAGDVAGAPLIKLAIHDGSSAVDAIAASLAGAGPPPAGTLDLAVIGAGPAGLAGLFRARELGLVAAAFEKGDAAQTIQLFPRAKLVRVLPLDLPLVGTLPLEAGKDGGIGKEALLTQWLRLVREEGLDVRERHEVVGLRPLDGGGFDLDLLAHPRGRGVPERKTVRARRVLVAIGRRGTPKPLESPVDPGMAGRIAYHLADAAALRGLSVGISGLGDTAMEAAIALGEQDGTHVHVVYRGAELRTAGRDARNVRHFKDLVGRGRVTVHWSSAIARVEPGAMVLTPDARVRIDQLLVFHGGTTPYELLARFGVKAGTALVA